MMDRVDTLKRAPKRASAKARCEGAPIGWKRARSLGERWCIKMWPDFFSPGSRKKKVA